VPLRSAGLLLLRRPAGASSSEPESDISVVITVNKGRTQNGHIRNDTRDVSRRILTA
jgi:hypothetical protein